MRKNKIIAFISTIVLGLMLAVVPAKAEEASYISVSNYTETFKPVNEHDAELTVEVTATVGEDGYVYFFNTVEGMVPGTVSGTNVETTLEEYNEGSVKYYRVKAIDPTAEASLTATFTCAGFYDVKLTADTNGGNAYSMSYKFTNYFASKIGKYSVYIYAPEGMAIVKVSAPSAYADYILGEEDGMRYAGLSKALAAAANTTLTYTYNAPMGSFTKILVWAVCLGVGAFVFVDRYKKAKQD